MTVRTQRDRTPAVSGDAEETLGGGAVGGVAAEALEEGGRPRPPLAPRPGAAEVAGVRVPAVVLRDDPRPGGVDVQRVTYAVAAGMAGLAKVGAGGEEEKVPVVRQVGVVAHVAVLAHLPGLHGVLGQRAIEGVEAAICDGAVVAAVARGRDTRKTLVPGVGVLAPQERRAGVARQGAELAGRDPRGPRPQPPRRHPGPHPPPPALPVRPSG